jgi:hypothetical protein
MERDLGVRQTLADTIFQLLRQAVRFHQRQAVVKKDVRVDMA